MKAFEKRSFCPIKNGMVYEATPPFTEKPKGSKKREV
jgi:hypothetical protein